MADGHLTVSYPGGPAAEIQRHLKNGGRLFPYEVYVSGTALFIRSALGGSATPLAGRRVEAINDVPAEKIAEKLLAHMNGDTPALRAALLSDRFAFWYWKFFGEHRGLKLRIGGFESAIEGSSALPSAFREKSFEELFQFELLDGDAALLTIREFYWSDKPRLHDFTRAVFQRMRDAGTRKLIIDIRANGGGDDDVWIDGIMPYIATRPFRNGSTYALKIIEGRAKEGQKVGDVVHGAQDTVYPPQLDNPLPSKARSTSSSVHARTLPQCCSARWSRIMASARSSASGAARAAPKAAASSSSSCQTRR